MKSRNLISKVPQTGGVTQGALLLCAKITLLVAVFCLVGQPALAKGVKNCSKTAKFAFKACKNEAKDDYYIAVGNCYYLTTKDQTEECISQAKLELKEAKEDCEDQKDARKDVCEAVGEDPYNPVINPANFVGPATIDQGTANLYFPLVPGYFWTYKTREGGVVTETNTVEVLAGESVMIEGVDCIVVHDIVYEGDTTDPAAIIEDTYDYYAQDMDGNVWYFGEFSVARQECDEETGELCEGLYGDEGSWQAGFEGGKPGIIMFADPSAQIDTVYRQEFALGDAEDAAQVISVDGSTSVTVPIDGGTTFDTNVLNTWDFSPMEPDVGENKFYAPGVGMILEVASEEGVETGERNELESASFYP